MKTKLFESMLIVLLLASGASAQLETAKKSATVEHDNVVTVVYDIRDLLHAGDKHAGDSALIPPTKIGQPKPALIGGGEGGGVGGGANPNSNPNSDPKLQPPTNDDAAGDEILKVIVDTVAPETWRDNGGNVGSVRLMSGLLIVSQTPDNQKLIQALFSQLREESSHMVTVVARWVLLDSAQLEQYAQPLKQAEGTAAIETINLGALEKANVALKYRAQITCFNGQTVHLTSGRARTVVTGLEALVGQGGAAYQPDASAVQDGISLQLTPMLPVGSPTALVEIDNVVSSWNGLAPAPPAPTSQPTNMEAPGTLDRVDIAVQHLHTTVAVPVGKPILVGGLSMPSQGDTDATDKQMYLVIEVLGVK